MTGFGKAEATYQGKTIHAEVKSLNSKALDLSTRLANQYRALEPQLRTLVADTLSRGKIELVVWVEQGETVGVPAISAEAVALYREQMDKVEIATNRGMPRPTWGELLRLPGVLMTGEKAADEPNEEELAIVTAAVREALAQLVAFRRQEGAALECKFTEKIDAIAALQQELEPYAEARVPKIRQRILDGLAELDGVQYDPNRLEQEMIYYIEKLDISEEKQRLTNHLRYFRETMALDTPVGKKLGFIAQEMGREINTTGSKSNDAEMQNIVVRMKDELEQIKEQVLNAL